MTAKSDKTIRVCFLDVNSSYSHSSLALPMLHAICAKLDFLDWRVVRGTINDEVSRLSAAVIEQRPDVVLGTAYLFNQEFLLKVLRRVHAVLPECTVILGGPEFLDDNEAFLQRESCVDAVVRGEGEPALPALLKGLHAGVWADITTGLCRMSNGAYIDNGHAVLDADDWSALPSPYSDEFAVLDRPFVQIETARGCPHRCTFCTSALATEVRRLPIERIRESLTIAREHGIREIRILDRTFNAQKKHAMQLMRMFRSEFSDLRFHLEIHPGYLEKIIPEFSDAPAGFYHLEVGIQTTVYESLKAVKRRQSQEDIWHGLYSLMLHPGLDLHVDLLAGLPKSNLSQMLEELEQISRYGPSEIQLEILKILPGTPIKNDTEKYGIVYAPDPPYEVLSTPGFTPEDLQTVRKLSMIVDRYYNHPMLHETTLLALRDLPDFFTDFLAHIEMVSDPFTPISLEKRALKLHKFLVDRAPEAAARLEIDWIRAGLSPSNGPAKAERRKDITSDAKLIEGSSDYIDGHVWYLENELGKYWFVFDRAKRRQGPVAVYE